jgi:phospholipase/carboxylesterase
MGPYAGRAWFSIDLEELDRAMREGRTRDLRKSIPPEFDSTLMILEKLVTELSTRHKTIILGGFSQGAMCASHLALRPSLRLDGLVLLSGALLAEERFPNEARGISFYQSHGLQDSILSVAGARDLEARLHSLQFQGKLREFPGGHEIPPSVLGEVKSFLHQFS